MRTPCVQRREAFPTRIGYGGVAVRSIVGVLGVLGAEITFVLSALDSLGLPLLVCNRQARSVEAFNGKLSILAAIN